MVQHPCSVGQVLVSMFFNCMLIHPTVMFRRIFSEQFYSDEKISDEKKDAKKVLYPETFPSAEDYALWLHVITVGGNQAGGTTLPTTSATITPTTTTTTSTTTTATTTVASTWKIANLPIPIILHLRKHATNSSKNYRNVQKENTEKIVVKCLDIISKKVIFVRNLTNIGKSKIHEKVYQFSAQNGSWTDIADEFFAF